MPQFAGYELNIKQLVNRIARIQNDITEQGEGPYAKQRAAFEAAQVFRDNPSAETAGVFSRTVFVWGGGHGLANYPKVLENTPTWGQHVHDWLTSENLLLIPTRDAIQNGRRLYIDTAFLSKHLRIFDPVNFATLDSILEIHLGYSLKPVGYERFIADLQSFKQTYHLNAPIGDIEQAMYELIQDNQ